MFGRAHGHIGDARAKMQHAPTLRAESAPAFIYQMRSWLSSLDFECGTPTGETQSGGQPKE